MNQSNHQDRKSWDNYWSNKTAASNFIYDRIAVFYRIYIIKGILNHFTKKYFSQGSKVLHAGCGSGQVDVDLLKHVSVTALDFSRPALEIYKRINGTDSKVIQANILKLPFKDGAFDGIYNLGVMEHFPDSDIKQILGEFHRVLKPDGKMVILWPPEFGLSVRFLKGVHFVLNRVLKKDIKLHPDEISRIQSKGQVKELFTKAGFNVLKYYFGPRDVFTYVVVAARKLSMPLEPKISVVMTVYNAEDFIAQAVKSILRQTFADFEFIIVDDASTDKTRDIITSFKDERIVLISNKVNLGQTKSLNIGIKRARAPYIARMDADDVALSERLTEQYAFLESHPEIAVVGSSVKFLDENGRKFQDIRVPTDPFKIRSYMAGVGDLSYWCMMHPSVLMRKSTIEEVGFYKETGVRSHGYPQDYELWSRLLRKYQFANIRRPLLKHSVLLSKSDGWESDQLNDRNAISREKIKFYIPSLSENEISILTDMLEYQRQGSKENGTKVFEIFDKYFDRYMDKSAPAVAINEMKDEIKLYYIPKLFATNKALSIKEFFNIIRRQPFFLFKPRVLWKFCRKIIKIWFLAWERFRYSGEKAHQLLNRLARFRNPLISSEIGLTLIGIVCLGYFLWWNRFAELHVTLPFINIPVFVGEILLILCLVLFFARMKDYFAKLGGWRIGIGAYIAFVILKALYGCYIYSQWPTLALRHAALFYYPLFAVLSYCFYSKEYFKERKSVILALLFFCVWGAFSRPQLLPAFMLTLALMMDYSLSKRYFLSSFLFIVFLLATFWKQFPFYNPEIVRFSRTELIGNLVGIVYLVYFLYMIANINKIIKVVIPVALCAIFLLAFASLENKGNVTSLIRFKDLADTFWAYDQQIKEKEKTFRQKPLIDVKLYNQNKDSLLAPQRPSTLTEKYRHEFVDDEFLKVREKVVEKLHEKFDVANAPPDTVKNRLALQKELEEKLNLKTTKERLTLIDRLNQEFGNNAKQSNIYSSALASLFEQRTEGVAIGNSVFRLFIWRDALRDLWKEKPLLGFSFGKVFRSISIEIIGWADGEWRRDGWLEMHNSFLTMIYRGGLVGLGLIIFILTVFVKTIKTFLYFKSVTGVFLTTALLYWLLISNFLVILELPYNAIPFWSLFGMSVAYAQELKNKIQGER